MRLTLSEVSNVKVFVDVNLAKTLIPIIYWQWECGLCYVFCAVRLSLKNLELNVIKNCFNTVFRNYLSN